MMKIFSRVEVGGVFFNRRLFAVLVLTLFCAAPGQYMEEFAMELPRPLPRWIYSSVVAGRYFASDMDFWGQLCALRSISPTWRLGVETGASPQAQSVFFSLITQKDLGGRLLLDGYQDQLNFSLGLLNFISDNDPACAECARRKVTPHLGLGYGRDISLLPRASWALRLQTKAAVILGESLTRKRSGIFGIPESRLAMYYISLELGVLWF